MFCGVVAHIGMTTEFYEAQWKMWSQWRLKQNEKISSDVLAYIVSETQCAVRWLTMKDDLNCEMMWLSQSQMSNECFDCDAVAYIVSETKWVTKLNLTRETSQDTMCTLERLLQNDYEVVVYIGRKISADVSRISHESSCLLIATGCRLRAR